MKKGNRPDYRPDEVKLSHLKLFLVSQGAGFPGVGFPYATLKLTLPENQGRIADSALNNRQMCNKAWFIIG
jgi:hypothetical protein